MWTVVAPVIISQKRGQPLIGCLSLFGWIAENIAGSLLRGGRSLIVAGVVVQDLGGALRAGLFEIGRLHEHGAAEFAYVVSAQRHVLGDIEPRVNMREPVVHITSANTIIASGAPPLSTCQRGAATTAAAAANGPHSVSWPPHNHQHPPAHRLVRRCHSRQKGKSLSLPEVKVVHTPLDIAHVDVEGKEVHLMRVVSDCARLLVHNIHVPAPRTFC